MSLLLYIMYCHFWNWQAGAAGARKSPQFVHSK